MTTSVMLVDDHQLVREGIKHLLDQNRFTVVGEASSPQEAVHMADRLRPDIVLLDMNMPGGNGVDAARRMMFTHPNIKIVLISMMPMKQETLRGLQSFIKGYISKSASASDLNNVLEHVAQGGSAFPEFDNNVPLIDSLTPREQDILRELVQGHSNKVIANNLDVAEGTIKVHIKTILKKLHVSNRTQAALYAYEQGFGSLDMHA